MRGDERHEQIAQTRPRRYTTSDTREKKKERREPKRNTTLPMED